MEDGSGFKIPFDKRKNAQHMQGNKVLVASFLLAAVCPMRLLMRLQEFNRWIGGLADIPGIQRAVGG